MQTAAVIGKLSSASVPAEPRLKADFASCVFQGGGVTCMQFFFVHLS